MLLLNRDQNKKSFLTTFKSFQVKMRNNNQLSCISAAAGNDIMLYKGTNDLFTFIVKTRFKFK